MVFKGQGRLVFRQWIKLRKDGGFLVGFRRSGSVFSRMSASVFSRSGFVFGRDSVGVFTGEWDQFFQITAICFSDWMGCWFFEDTEVDHRNG